MALNKKERLHIELLDCYRFCHLAIESKIHVRVPHEIGIASYEIPKSLRDQA